MISKQLTRIVNKAMFLRLAVTLLGMAVISLIVALPAQADTYTVCADGCDFTTIQAAIDDANVTAGDVIHVSAATHTEAGVTVNKDVTIQGQSAVDTIVQAHAEANTSDERVFFVVNGTSTTIRDMTIRHGNPTSEPEAGGGIRNEGTLTLENVVVTANSGSAGGGILNDGTLTIVNSSIRGNTARGGADHYLECSTGGGIKNMVGTVTLIDSTISDNVAEGKGGGSHVSCQGILVLINSTISGNSTHSTGGGVHLNGVGEFTNSTITANSANNGGGIYIEGSGEKDLIRGWLNYTNTIVAANSATFEKYGIDDCLIGDYATVGVSVNNLVGDGNCDPAHSGDPMLAALAANSIAPDSEHAPRTHTPLPGSPAIDAIPASECAVDTDQRGATRPQGSGCDIGAVEWRPGQNHAAGGTVSVGLLFGLLALPVIAIVGGLVAIRRLRQT